METTNSKVKFVPEITLGTILQTVIAVVPIGWIAISDHFEIRRLRERDDEQAVVIAALIVSQNAVSKDLAVIASQVREWRGMKP